MFNVCNEIHFQLTESYKHKSRRHPKGQRIALGLPQARSRPEDGSQDGGDHRPKIDGEVEDVEERAHLRLLLRERELLRAEGDHAGFDAAGAKGDEKKTDEGNYPAKCNIVTVQTKRIICVNVCTILTLEAFPQFHIRCRGRNPETRPPAQSCR